MQHLFVKEVLRSENDPETLRQLHGQNAGTRWFNIRHRNSKPVLHVYDRFNRVCEPVGESNPDESSILPTIVSFIGKSGVGKSTLVRAMLLLRSLDAQQIQSGGLPTPAGNQSCVEAFKHVRSSQGVMPVTRSDHLDHLADPTTFGVHLYRDDEASSAAQASPIKSTLFADCEGFFTGATQTNAERLTSSYGKAPLNDDAMEVNLLYKAPMEAESYTRNGQAGAELYYARFLYCLSDVVVFVTNEDQNITHLLVSALEWAATAVLHSVNYPSRKTLIIVRNGAEDKSQQIIDDESLARLYLDRQTVILWKTSPTLQKFVNEYNSRQDKYAKRIWDNRDLYDVLFDKTHCFCVPRVGQIEEHRDETMFTRYLGLRTMIDNASRRAISMRSQVWMTHDVPSFSQMLFAAMEHFRTSDEEFNFNKVAKFTRPQSSSGHIANFLRLVLKVPNSSRARAMVADVVALSYVVWFMRTLHQVVDPEHLFDSVSTDENDHSLSAQCHSAIKEYEEKHQQCGYQFADGGRCINGPAAAHRQLHLSASKKQAQGSLVPGHIFDPHLSEQIRSRFLQHYTSMLTGDRSSERLMTKPRPEKITRVRESILQKYSPQWSFMTSNTTCLGCLQAVPENVLNCGHGYCIQCVRELGRASDTFESAWTFEVCTLCCARTGDNYSHLIREPPRCAGVRALTLDGGGIRGIIELALIAEMEKELGLGIPFRDYFDLIVGTSTGGIIGLAIAMGNKSASTQTALLTQAFKGFASATFAHPRAGRLLTKIGLGHFMTSVVMSVGLYEALFDSTPLRKGLEGFFGLHTSLFSSARTRHHQCSTRVAVIATKEFGKKAHLITSYNRATLGSDSDFEREDDDSSGMKIWEAGLATSAAPFYLPPFRKPETGTVYFDGALHMNCPAPEAVEEIRKIWPERTPPLDVLVSLGTGVQDSEVKIPKAIRIGGFAEICRSFHRQLDSEHQWEQFRTSSAANGIGDRLHRLNPPIDEDLQKVTLWQWDKMTKLEKMVQRQMQEPAWKARLASSANALLASLFYFEPDAVVPSSPKPCTPTALTHDSPIEFQGTIRTRLRHGSPELRSLLGRIGGLVYTKPSTSSRVISGGDPVQHDTWTEITAFTTMKSQVKQSHQPFRVPVQFSETSENKSLLVAVRFKNSAVPVPISGFPTTVLELRVKAGARD